MTKWTIILTTVAVSVILLGACDKAPGGVIKESDMAHVLADFAKANAIIEQNPNLFPDDSSKLALKQSLLEKYDADLAMYDSSLVWYAHNLKIYSEVHDKAIQILEKEGNIKSGNASKDIWLNGADNSNSNQGGMQPDGGAKRVFPTSGDSANVWNEPQRWILTSAMQKGYITFDYKPDKESRSGDLYALNMKLISNNSIIKLLLAIDYLDGTTSYINRSATVMGWSSYYIQTDTTRSVKRIYGFINYNIKPFGIALLDSIYLLRTHLDPEKYNMIGIQHNAASKAIREREQKQKELQEQQAQQEQQARGFSESSPLPGRNALPKTVHPQSPINRNPVANRRKPDGSFRPLPGRKVEKPSPPSRDRRVNPNGAHMPHAPIK